MEGVTEMLEGAEENDEALIFELSVGFGGMGPPEVLRVEMRILRFNSGGCQNDNANHLIVGDRSWSVTTFIFKISVLYPIERTALEGQP